MTRSPTRDALAEALRPFAELADTYEPPENDDGMYCWRRVPTIGDLRRARNALAEYEAEPQGWRTMETAPKDGTRVDLWCRAPGFFAGQCRVPDCWFYDGYWRRSDPEFGDASGTSKVHNVTHWHAIPLPPETKE